MSADLARSYRRALAWYPRRWRDENADVMVGTLLDVADADHRIRPRPGELAGLAASGLSTRLGMFLEPSARNAISTIALATGAAYPLAYFAFQLWSPWSSEHAPDMAAFGFRPVMNPGLIIAGAWLVALMVALFVPHQRGLKPTIAIATLAPIALILVYRIPGIGNGWYGLMTTSLAFLALLGVLALIGTPARGLRLAIPAALAFAAITGGYLATQFSLQGLYFDERSFWNVFSVSLTILLVIAAIATVALGLRHHRSAAQTVALSASPWALVVLRFAASQNLGDTFAMLGIAIALVGFGALIPLAFRRMRPNDASKI